MTEAVKRNFSGRIHHPPRNSTVLWDMLSPCNFSCSYCYSERLTVRPRKPTASEAKHQLEAFAEHLPGWNVNLSGGEPMLHPDLVDLVSGLSRQGNHVGIYTNLSRSHVVERLVEQVDPQGVEFINAGIHAEQRTSPDPELRGFARSFLLLADAGFPIHASYIIHPENLHRVQEDVERLSQLGVRVRIQVFRGVWQGSSYPAAFTPHEMAIVGAWEADLDRGRDVRMDFTGQAGSCAAGAMYLEMDPNGDCWRCGSYRSMRREALGNLFDGTLAINSGPRRCRIWACLSCRQGHAFHLDGLADLFEQPATPVGLPDLT